MLDKVKFAVFLGFTLLGLYPLLLMVVTFVLYPAPRTVSQAMETVALSTTIVVIGLWISQLITQIEKYTGERQTRPAPILPPRMTRKDIREMITDAVRQIYDEAEQDEQQRETEKKDEVTVTSTRPPNEV